MLDAQGNTQYRPNTQLARAIDIMFILHAEHELNCSTSAMRHLTSSGVDVFSSVAGESGARARAGAGLARWDAHCSA